MFARIGLQEDRLRVSRGGCWGPDRKLLYSRTASFLLHCFKQSRLLASTAAAAAHKLFALSTLPLGRSALHWDLQHSYDFWFVKKTSLLKLYLFN